MSASVLRKLAQVRRRLNLAHFLRISVWTLTASLFVGCGVVLLDKAWPLGLSIANTVAAALGSSFFLAMVITWLTRRNNLAAALELDRAFDLRERVSTLVSLKPAELEQPAALALQADVERRADELIVSERLPILVPRLGWLPALPLAILLAIAYLVAPFNWMERASARSTTPEERRKIAEEAQILEKKLAERKKEAADQSIPEELKELTAKIEKATKDLGANEKMGVKDAVLQLSDLAKSIEQQRKQLESLDMIKQSLSKLPAFPDGTGQKLSQALKKGDFKEAAKQLKELQKQMKEGKMSAGEKEKLAKQLQELQKQLKQMAEMTKRADQLKKSLNPEMLKQELAKLAKDAEQMKQLKELAEKLGECSKCMNGENGKNQKQLEEALAKAQETLGQMMKDDAAREMLENLRSDLDACRGGMCEGMNEGENEKVRRGDFARGRGRGAGAREESPDETKSRQTRSKSQLHKGQVFVVGQTEGKSFKGESILEIREAAASAARAADEAVTRQKVPEDYKEHTRDYFERLNGQLSK